MEKTRIALMLCSLLLNACVATSRSEKPQFGNIQQASELSGIYRNRGLTPEARPVVYLSAIIWPDDTSLKHADVETIEVTASAPGTIRVNAFSKAHRMIISSEFVEDRDFKIVNGRIRLKTDSGIAGLKTGEPLVGAYHGFRELGLDISGHGKYRSHYTIAGLVYLVVPAVADVQEDVHFEKITAKKDIPE